MKRQSIWQPRNLFPVADVLLHATVVTDPVEANCRPFGLRYLVDPHPSAASDVDLAAMRLDGASQITVMGDQLGGMPAFKHTSGKTKTTTNVDDRQASDDDDDYEQD